MVNLRTHWATTMGFAMEGDRQGRRKGETGRQPQVGGGEGREDSKSLSRNISEKGARGARGASEGRESGKGCLGREREREGVCGGRGCDQDSGSRDLEAIRQRTQGRQGRGPLMTAEMWKSSSLQIFFVLHCCLISRPCIPKCGQGVRVQRVMAIT